MKGGDADSDLVFAVAVSDSGIVVVEGVVVNGDAVGRACLCCSEVASSDGSAFIVVNDEVALKFLFDGDGQFWQAVFFHEGEDGGVYWREVVWRGEDGFSFVFAFLGVEDVEEGEDWPVGAECDFDDVRCNFLAVFCSGG